MFLFFLLTTPLAAATMVFFRNIMRREIPSSVRRWKRHLQGLWRWLSFIPVTRAHALEEEEVTKMTLTAFRSCGERL